MNNLYPKRNIISDKNQIKQFYKWLSILKYNEIQTNKQELAPGTEFSIVAYDASDDPLILMAYSKTDKQFEIKNKVYNLKDKIETELQTLIDKK